MSQPRGRKKEQSAIDEKLGGEYMTIVKYLRHDVCCKKAPLNNTYVDYLKGEKIVDGLLGSKWGIDVNSVDPVFVSRNDCTAFMRMLIDQDMMKRAEKIYKKPKSETDDKKRFCLKILNEETDFDEDGFYVWFYDPPTTSQYLLGVGVVMLVIAGCLFPLWPRRVRSIAFYGSMSLAGFFGFIMALAVFKYILFVSLWTITFGEIHFWLFPNLTEDVGFFESFVPVYVYTRYSEVRRKKEERKEKKKKADSTDESDSIEPNERHDKND